MSMLNDKVFLIGMPGCGKTTIGKLLAKELNYTFYDMDKYIVDISGKEVHELFNEGEEVFRKWETEACKELSKKRNSIISTGGGVIKTSVNREILRSSGLVVFIDRPVENIIGDVDINTRPLLKNGAGEVYKLYEERYELYKETSHIKVLNDGFIRDTIDNIKKSLNGRIKE